MIRIALIVVAVGTMLCPGFCWPVFEGKDAHTAVEYVQEFDTDDLRLHERARQLADDTMQLYPADFAVRWEPIRLANVDLALQYPGDAPPAPRAPRQRIKITPFPGVSFMAENERFRDSGYGFSWRGRIANGNPGKVIIHSVPQDGPGANVTFVYIQSEFGAFRIAPTSDPDIHVAYEANRFYNPPQQ